MAAVITVTEEDALNDIRLGIAALFPSSQIIYGLENRVAMPAGGFIEITAVGQKRLATNETDYTDQFPAGNAPYPPGYSQANMSTRYDVQIDCYGAFSCDWANIISNTMRSDYGCSVFSIVQPLSADDPTQIPIQNGENQYEKRWLVSASFQYRPGVRTPVYFSPEVPLVDFYPPADTSA